VTAFHSSFVSGDGRYVHALRLLRLTRLRREFRTVGMITLAAFGLSTCVFVGLRSVSPFGSPLWNLADEAWVIGFLVALGVLAICIIGVLVLRFAAGRTGQVASAFAPIFRRGEAVMVEGDEDSLRGLLARLNKRQSVSVVVLVVCLSLAGLGVGAGFNVAPAYAGNHGRGGVTVTIGKDAFLARVEHTGKTTDYYIDTTVGEALAEDGSPTDGERWVVLPSEDNQVAYLVGGYDYLLIGALSMFGGLGVIVCAVMMFFSVRREHRRRAVAGHVPLAYSVRRLAAGARPMVVFRRGPAATIGLPALPYDTDAAAAYLLRGRRRNAALVFGAVVVVLGLGASAIVVFGGSGSTQAAQTSSRQDITLPYLASTLWSVDVVADYTDTADAIRDVTVDMLRQGGVPGTARVGAAWRVIISSKTGNSQSPVELTADVDVSEIGSASPARAVAGGVAFDKSIVAGSTGVPSPAAVNGLPAGWNGVVIVQASDASTGIVDLFGSATGSLVEIEADGPVHDTTITTRAVELANAIARQGIANFVYDTRH
jgi:hypothetical protein